VFELVLAPGTASFDPEDDRWRQQVSLLFTNLEVALGSAGAFTAALQFFRAWLDRDKSRHLEVGIDVDGRHERIVLRGGGLSEQAFETLVTAAATRLAAEP
jgi:hypothetical protein